MKKILSILFLLSVGLQAGKHGMLSHVRNASNTDRSGMVLPPVHKPSHVSVEEAKEVRLILLEAKEAGLIHDLMRVTAELNRKRDELKRMGNPAAEQQYLQELEEHAAWANAQA